MENEEYFQWNTIKEIYKSQGSTRENSLKYVNEKERYLQ